MSVPEFGRLLELPTPRWMLPLLAPGRYDGARIYKGARGGRGSGKSHGFAEMLVERHLVEKLDAVCVREVQRTLNQSVKKLIEGKIEAMNAGAYFDVQDKRIISSRGGLTIFEGMQNHTNDSIKSLEGFKIAWVEEAQSLSQRSLDLLRPTIRLSGSELWFTWNPDQPTDPVDALLLGENPPPGTVVVEVNYEDNPWFPEVLREEMEYDKRRDPDKYLHIWKGHYRRNSEARVFRNWSIEEFDVPDGTAMRQGADWGFSVDPSVLIQCYTVGRKMYVPYEAYMVGCEIDNLPDLFDGVPDSRKFFTTADSARPETISYMRRKWSERINAAVKGAKSLEDGVEFLKTFDIVVHPRCKHLIDELTLYSYKVDEHTKLVLPILADRDNHVIDALRYANEGARRHLRAQETAAPVAAAIPMTNHYRRGR